MLHCVALQEAHHIVVWMLGMMPNDYPTYLELQQSGSKHFQPSLLKFHFHLLFLAHKIWSKNFDCTWHKIEYELGLPIWSKSTEVNMLIYDVFQSIDVFFNCFLVVNINLFIVLHWLLTIFVHANSYRRVLETITTFALC